MEDFILSSSNASFWINASAGTGKTTILVKRVLSLLLQFVSPNRILCITFTNAVSSEMKTRISQELAKWVFMNEESLQQDIYNLLGRPPNKELLNYSRTLFALMLEDSNSLKIQTLHSFCNNLLQKFSFEAEISPNFKLLNENDLIEIFTESKFSLYQKIDKSTDLQEALNVINSYSSEFSLTKLLKSLIENKEKFENLIQKYSKDQIIDNLYTKFYIDKNINFKAELMQVSINIKAVILDLEKGENIDKVLAIKLNQFLNSGFNHEYLSIFLTKEGDIRKKIISTYLAKKNPDLYNALLLEQERISKNYLQLQIQKLLFLSKAIIQFGDIFIKIFNHNKKAKDVIDYDDLIICAKNLLQENYAKDWVLYKLDNQIDHILLDEAQDTNIIQWKIINALSEDFFSGNSAQDTDKSIFIVGDEKQSIYSFQGADHKYFSEMFHFYKKKILASQRKFYHLNLTTSYRSSKAILNVVDNIFNNPKLIEKIALTTSQIRHSCHNENDFGKVEIWPLITKEHIGDKKYTIYYLLAYQIALKIKELLSSNLRIKNRKIQPKDFLILVRKRSYFTKDLIKLLDNFNIPVSGIDRLNLNDEISIEDLIAVGNFALMQEDDLNLASLLKSPIFNMKDEELEKICIARTGSLWSYIKENDKYKNLYDELENIVSFANSSPYQFYFNILYNLEKCKEFYTRFGIGIKDIIDEFLSLVAEYELKHPPILQNFIKWICHNNIQIKRNFDASENKVRILTIHGAKGLEAPIVIMADTTSVPFNQNSEFYLDEEIILWKTSKNYQNNFLYQINNSLQEEIYNEYIRLLYVALTRAATYLIIAGATSYTKLDVRSWYNIIDESFKTLNYSSIKNNIHYPENIKVPNLEIKFFENGECLFEKKSLESEQISLIPNYLKDKEPLQVKKENIHFTLKDFAIKIPPYNNQIFINKQKIGILTHKLLELITEISEVTQKDFIDIYLAKQNLTNEESNEIKENCTKILIDFPKIFTKSSLNEVKIGGKLNLYGNERIFIGRVDKLIIGTQAIEVIDFKTGNKITERLLDQVYIYQSLLSKMFDIKTDISLLWVENGTKTLIEENIIQNLRTKMEI